MNIRLVLQRLYYVFPYSKYLREISDVLEQDSSRINICQGLYCRVCVGKSLDILYKYLSKPLLFNYPLFKLIVFDVFGIFQILSVYTWWITAESFKGFGESCRLNIVIYTVTVKWYICRSVKYLTHFMITRIQKTDQQNVISVHFQMKKWISIVWI